MGRTSIRCHSSFQVSFPLPSPNSALHLLFSPSYTLLLPCLISSLSLFLFSTACSPGPNPPTDQGTTPNKTSHPSLLASLSPSISENPLLNICCRTNSSSLPSFAHFSHSGNVMGSCGVRVGEGTGRLEYALEGRREKTPSDEPRSSTSSSSLGIGVSPERDPRIRAWAASSDRRARSPSSATTLAHFAKYNLALSNSLATSFPFCKRDLLFD